MPRPKRHRSKILDQVGAVTVKTPYQHLVQLGRARFGFAPVEAEEVAHRAEAVLASLVERADNHVLFAAQASHRKGDVSTVEVCLSPFAYEDLELLGEFGLATMQLGRLARLVEEAEDQGGLLTRDDLGLLTAITVRSIGVRLGALCDQGLRLVIAGASQRRRGGMRRQAEAMRRVLAGQAPDVVRRELAIAASSWTRIRFQFARLATVKRAWAKTAAALGVAAGLAVDYRTVAAEAVGSEALTRLLAEFSHPTAARGGSGGPEADFARELRTEHGLSPAAARALCAELGRLAEQTTGERAAGAVVFWAVAATEPAGRPLCDCELVPVTLDLVHPDDGDVWQRHATRALKWTRVLRLSGQAWVQGAYLSQADLAFLMGVDVGVIGRLVSAHPTVVLPTRGNMADMGPGLTHAQKIVRLFLEGYTETEIKARTGHTYASIERYLLTFAKVVLLTERGLPAPLIRRTIGCSTKLVASYLALYAQFDKPDYAWALMAVRRLGEAHPRPRRTPGPRREARKKGVSSSGGPAVSARPGVRHYAPLPQKTLVGTARAELALRFDLSEDSWLAEEACRRFDTAMSAWEQTHGVRRLRPGELLVRHHDQLVALPLLTEDWAQALAAQASFKVHKPRVLAEAARRLDAVSADATGDDVARYLDRRALLPRYCPGGLPDGRIPKGAGLVDPAAVGARPRTVPREVDVPAQVASSLTGFLGKQAGVAPARGRAMLRELARLRAWCCPSFDEVIPGQVAWLAGSVTKHKRPGLQLARRIQVPVILTLFTDGELAARPQSWPELNELHMHQAARMAVEAWRQGGLLPTVEFELLFLRSSTVFVKLLRAYMQRYQVILPTPGTILDAGRCMTHKDIVIRLHLEGLFTAEIARRIYHTPEAVDAYLKVFHAVLILYLYDIPPELMSRVTGKGLDLIGQHLALVEEHFPDPRSIKEHLRAHGVAIP